MGPEASELLCRLAFCLCANVSEKHGVSVFLPPTRKPAAVPQCTIRHLTITALHKYYIITIGSSIIIIQANTSDTIDTTGQLYS
jgi:hypothetical protein